MICELIIGLLYIVSYCLLSVVVVVVWHHIKTKTDMPSHSDNITHWLELMMMPIVTRKLPVFSIGQITFRAVRQDRQGRRGSEAASSNAKMQMMLSQYWMPLKWRSFCFVFDFNSVVIQFMCGEYLYGRYLDNFLLNIVVEKFFKKSVHIHQSYDGKSSVLFSEIHCTTYGNKTLLEFI